MVWVGGRLAAPLRELQRFPGLRVPLLMYVQYAAEGPSSPGNLSEPAGGRLGKVDASGYAASQGADGIRRQALSGG